MRKRIIGRLPLKGGEENWLALEPAGRSRTDLGKVPSSWSRLRWGGADTGGVDGRLGWGAGDPTCLRYARETARYKTGVRRAGKGTHSRVRLLSAGKRIQKPDASDERLVRSHTTNPTHRMRGLCGAIRLAAWRAEMSGQSQPAAAGNRTSTVDIQSARYHAGSRGLPGQFG
jgi:hypothetical protein